MKQITTLYLFLILLGCKAQNSEIFLSNEFVDLKEKQSLTIIKNSTSDTLKLSGTFFSILPYSESNFSLSIVPNRFDTLIFNFAYPDFIYIDNPHYLQILNSPGKTLYCDIFNFTSKSADISFKGDLASINEYYLTYHNKMGAQFEANRPYFSIGDHLKDFNKFPLIADSLTALSVNFLDRYQLPLPPWFKKHESWRLKYLGAFLKYNVLISKEFYGGTKLNVSDNYYSFEKDLPMESKEMILNTEYLWYTYFYIGQHTKQIKMTPDRSRIISFIDSLAISTSLADILRMYQLSFAHLSSNSEYELLYKKTFFNDSLVKMSFDSLMNAKHGLPKIGETVPDLSLIDEHGNTVSLLDYKGKYIMINFWATWCGACIVEFPYENKLFQKYKNDGLVVINICVDTDVNKWKSITKKRNLKTINLFSLQDEFRTCKFTDRH